jgi:N-acetylneuraminate synthase
VSISIDGRRIGSGCPAYVIAEVSANHHQDYRQAEQLVREAKRAGADAIKLQTYTADTMTIDSDAEMFQVGAGSTWAGRNLYELYEEAHTPWEWHAPLQKVAAEEGLSLFSTPFDETAVDFLESLNVPAYKVASFEVVDIPLLERVGRTGKPVILSTGLASQPEIADAVNTLRAAGCRELVLLRCASAYPAQPADSHLAAMRTLADLFDVEVGLSDHSMDAAVAIAAVALGASVIEKHFILDRRRGGPDSSFSVEPAELADLVRQLRVAEAAIGNDPAIPGATPAERSNLAFRRSLFVVADIAAGEPFTATNIRALRPGHGLPPKHLRELLGRRAARAIKRGTPMSWDLVAR